MSVNLLFPQNNSTVPLLSDMHKKFFEDGGNKDTGLEEFDYMNLYWQGVDNSFPEAVTLQWETELTSLYIIISENADFKESRKIDVTGNMLKLYNLNIGKKYFWKVAVNDEKQNLIFSDTFTFRTEDTPPRWIKASDTTKKDEHGITNVRDMGGWKTKDGFKIKQNLIYRGSEFDDHILLTDYSKNTLANELKIKTDFDVRIKDEKFSPLGEDVNYINIHMHGTYGRISEFKDEYKEMFKVFINKENYPVYVHCWGGADRTGTLLALLLGILNVSEEDIFLEYELTSFSVWGPRSSNSELFTKFKNELDTYGNENDSFTEKCKNFVLSTGITQEEIETIRQIMLE